MKITGILYRKGADHLLKIALAGLMLIGGSTPENLTKAPDVIVIPLKNAGRFYLIEAIIDDQQGNLIFDTGATDLVLNNAYFRKYVRNHQETSQGITGSTGRSEWITTNILNASGLRYYDTGAILTNLSHIENKCGVKILGLFGFKLIKDFEVVIDLRNNELRLYRINKDGNRLLQTTDQFTSSRSLKMEESKNIIFLNCSVAGKELRFCLDTGAETNAIDIHCPDNVLRTISVEGNASLSGAGTNRTNALLGTMTDFRIGQHEIKNMKTIVTNLDALKEAYNKEMGGMLGYDFLIKGPVCINFTKKEFKMKILNQEQ